MQSKMEDELTKLKEKIDRTKSALNRCIPEYEAQKKREEAETGRLAICEQRRKELYAKQGRGNQFTSRDDRDRWINKELKGLQKAIKDKEEQIKRLDEDLTADQVKAQELDGKMQVLGRNWIIYIVVFAVN